MLLAVNPQRFVMPANHTGITEEFWNRYKQHLRSVWFFEELDLSPDLKDIEKLTDNELQFIYTVLAFFVASDGIVNENLAARFMQEVQIPEVRAFYGVQIMMENIHSETYTGLLEMYIRDPKELAHYFNAIETIPSIKKKANWALKYINSETATFAERLVAFACVEGIMFSGSFCAIFWLKKRNLLKSGLCKSNELIARDEAMHRDFACLLYQTLEHTRLSDDKVLEIVTEAVDHEIEFVCEALKVRLLGMNDEMMSEYIRVVADHLLVALGYDKLYNAKNPFDFMELQSLNGKTNFFEERVSEYSKVLSSSKEGVNVGGQKIFSLEEDF